MANSVQSHEHGEKLEEDGETGDKPAMAKPTGTVHFVWGIQPGAALPGANDLRLPLSNDGGVPSPSKESAASFGEPKVPTRRTSGNILALSCEERCPKRSDTENEDGGDGPGLDAGQVVTPVRSSTQHQEPRNLHVRCLKAPRSVHSQIRLISRWTSQISGRRQICCSSSAPRRGTRNWRGSFQQAQNSRRRIDGLVWRQGSC